MYKRKLKQHPQIIKKDVSAIAIEVSISALFFSNNLIWTDVIL